MSIEWLYELERAVDDGDDVFACPGMGKDQWEVARSIEELRFLAKQAAVSKQLPVYIVRLSPPRETGSGNFLVPVAIEPLGLKGQIRWAIIGSLEAALVMRDVRHGPSPVFGMQVQETVGPE